MDYGQFEFEPCSAPILSRRGFNFDDTARLQYSTRPGQTSVLDPAYFTHPTSLVYCERKQKETCYNNSTCKFWIFIVCEED